MAASKVSSTAVRMAIPWVAMMVKPMVALKAYHLVDLRASLWAAVKVSQRVDHWEVPKAAPKVEMKAFRWVEPMERQKVEMKGLLTAEQTVIHLVASKDDLKVDWKESSKVGHLVAQTAVR